MTNAATAENIEHRTFPAKVSDVRRPASGEGIVCAGYAIVYEPALSEDLGGFVESISPDALAGTLEDGDIRALYNHDGAQLLGRQSNGSLKLLSVANGLAFTLTLPETSLGAMLPFCSGGETCIK